MQDRSHTAAIASLLHATPRRGEQYPRFATAKALDPGEFATDDPHQGILPPFNGIIIPQNPRSVKHLRSRKKMSKNQNSSKIHDFIEMLLQKVYNLRLSYFGHVLFIFCASKFYLTPKPAFHTRIQSFLFIFTSFFHLEKM